MKKQGYVIALAAILLWACKSTENKNTTQKSTETETTISLLSDSSISSSCPYFTRDTKGNLVMSFIKQGKDSNPIMCYAYWIDSTKSFGSPIEIPASKGLKIHKENAPKIIFTPKDNITAVWGISNDSKKHPYAAFIYYIQSFDNGKTWNEPQKLVNDTNSYSQRFYDLAKLSNGTVALIWIDNRKETNKEGQSLYYASTEGKNGFQNIKPIGSTTCTCCRTKLLVDKESNIHVLYRKIINDSIRDIVQSSSMDNGKSFSQYQRISPDNYVIYGCPESGPDMTENKNGLQYVWYTKGGVFYKHSIKNDDNFTKRNNVSGNWSARHPQITTLPNDNIVITWDESIKKKENYRNRIGIQERSLKGKLMQNKYISSAKAILQFPIVAPLEDNIIIAYTKTRDKNDRIFYQLINYK